MLQINSLSSVCKKILLLLCTVTLSSCASAPPKDPNNICTILSQNKVGTQRPPKHLSDGGCLRTLDWRLFIVSRPL